MPTNIPATITNVFDNTKTGLYRIRLKVYSTHADTDSITIKVGSRQVFTDSLVQNTWYGVDFQTTMRTTDSRNLTVTVVRGGSYFTGTFNFYIKDLIVEQLQKAEVQDSDILNAGRRRSHYEGTKLTATDINVDSPDTIDGGPVITINTVAASVPSSNPIGSSVILNNPSANISANTNNQSQA